MSEINAIKQLRERMKKEFCIISANDLEYYLDLIDAEIAEHYKKLPLDSNGTPIDEGDTWVSYSGEVKKIQAISNDCVYVLDKKCRPYPITASACSIIKNQRTVEDVLRDYGVDVAHDFNADPDETISEATIEKYAAELRDLLGGDAE